MNKVITSLLSALLLSVIGCANGQQESSSNDFYTLPMPVMHSDYLEPLKSDTDNKEPYAIFKDDTLTFFYTENKPSNAYSLKVSRDDGPEWIEKYDEIIEESEEQGKMEGIERAKKDSYEQGFKDGIIRGIEKGMALSFIEIAKRILEVSNNKKNQKILKMINNIHTDKYEELEQKVKVIKTNIILVNKNNIVKEKKDI